MHNVLVDQITLPTIEQDEDLAYISRGAVFTAYLKEGTALPVTVFYDHLNGQGALFWCKVAGVRFWCAPLK